MKKYILGLLVLTAVVIACNDKDGDKTSSGSSSIKLPYEASYTTEFTHNVSDSDLLVVLNSYKYWENSDMAGLRSTMGDSMTVHMSDGFRFSGSSDSLIKIWSKYRDSLSSVKITMDVWLKNHSVKDSMDYVNVWFKQVETFKDGRVDSFNFQEDNGIKNGKIVWYSSHKQKL